MSATGPAGGMSTNRPSVFDLLAPRYDHSFRAPHRAAYDQLAWERVRRLLPSRPGLVVDAGCGSGRWAARITELGHRMIGIESSPSMAAASRVVAGKLPAGCFEVLEESMDEVELGEAPGADLVIAMGSLQYTRKPQAVLSRFASWVRPGGGVALLVDSLVAVTLELLGRREDEKAMRQLETGRGEWSPAEAEGSAIDLFLFDRAALEQMMRVAGFESLESAGLLVSMTGLGREEYLSRFSRSAEELLALDRRLAGFPTLADVGKQLFVSGRRPTSAAGVRRA